MGSTHGGTTGTAYCKCHWVSDSGVQTPIYPVQLLGCLRTEQETRSVRVLELVSARPPVSPGCTELQTGGQMELDIGTGVGRRTEGLPGTGGQVRPVPRLVRWLLNSGRFSRFMDSYSWVVWLFLPLAQKRVGMCGLCRFVQQVFMLFGRN